MKNVSSDWLKNMTAVTQVADKTQDYLADLELTWHYMAICGVVAFFVSIASLFFIRYFAGVFVWLIILIFLLSIFGLTYFSKVEYERLALIAAEEGVETDQNSNYYNAQNLETVYKVMVVVDIVVFLVILFNLSTISLAIAIIKSAALFVATNVWIVMLPIVFAIINIIFVCGWAVMFAYLYSIGTPTSSTTNPFVSVQWENQTIYYIMIHVFSLFWNIAFINYLSVFIIACSCSIWYYNNKESPNYFPRPIATSVWWAFRYHLGSIALAAFILAVVWVIQVILAYITNYVEGLKKKGVESKMITYMLKCLNVYVACFERVIKFISKMGFVQVAISGKSFCVSCMKAFMIVLSNPMKFGIIIMLGTIFTFIGKLFVSAACGVIGYIALNQDKELSEKLKSQLFPVFMFIGIGYVVASLFFMIYGIASDAILLCFFQDKELAEAGGRPVTAPEPMKVFYEKYKK